MFTITIQNSLEIGEKKGYIVSYNMYFHKG